MCSRKWLIVALVACGLASACSNYNTNLSIQTSSSTLSFVSPSTATVGGQGFTITANGSGFTTGALILWNGKALTTTLVSSNQLTAPVPASDLATAGTVQVAVQIPGSATSGTNINSTTTTEISNIVLFTIGAAPGTPPAITSLSASTTSAASTPYCSTQDFTLTVNGTNFTSDALVNWNGVPVSKSTAKFASATTFVSATQLTASIPAALALLPGTAAVTVSNLLGTSASLPITLVTPAGGFPKPTLTSITPNSAPAGTGGFPPFTVTAQGMNILPCTTVQWVDSNNVTSTLATTYVPAVAPTLTSPGNPVELIATVPAADLASPGTTNVKLVNPGTPASSTLGFTIHAPTIVSLSSSTNSSASTSACSPPGVTLTLNGTNFVNGSVVEWIVPGTPAITNPLATSFVSSTQLVAAIPPLDIAPNVLEHTVNIEVSNSGALSNMLPFTISPSSLSTPTSISVSPTAATAGASTATLIVTGGNILPCSVVHWTNGSGTTQLATKYVAATQLNPVQLSATVPVEDLASAGLVQVTAFNPPLPPSDCTPAVPVPCGGGPSNAVSFQIFLATITSLSASTTASNNTPFCSPNGLTLTVIGTGFVDGITVNWNGSPRPTTLVSPTQLTAEITAADTAFLGTGAAAVAITVSGSSPLSNSNSLKFSVMAPPTGTTFPAPAISSISPSSAVVETLAGPPIALTVNGSGFSPCSVVQWNGSPLPTNIFVGPNGIGAAIPTANLTAIGTDQVAVTTPTPGGGTSSNTPFTLVFGPGSPSTNRIAGGPLSLPLMSSNQRYGVYVLASTDGSTETPGTTQNIFVRDTCLGAPSGCTPSRPLVSAATNSNPGNADSIAPSINANSAIGSADGRYVAFLSSATNLVTPAVTNGIMNAFVRDTCAGTTSGCTPSTQLVSVTTGGTPANGATTSATIDATGRYITFVSTATNLGSISSSGGIFLRDTCAGAAPGCTPSTQPLD